MFQRRELAPHARLALQVDLAHGGTLAGRQHIDNGAPAVHHHAVAIGAAAVLVLTDLRRDHQVAEVLHRARAVQQVPVRLAGGHGEGGRHDEALRPCFDMARNSSGKRRS